MNPDGTYRRPKQPKDTAPVDSQEWLQRRAAEDSE